MSNPNPFASPMSAPGAGMGTSQAGGFTPRTATILSQTRGWVIFRAVLWYIVAAVLLIGMVGAADTFRRIPQFAGLGGLLIVALLVVFAIILVEAVLLTIFAAKIGHFLRMGDVAGMANAMKAQKPFWLFDAILAIIGGIFSLIGLINMLQFL